MTVTAAADPEVTAPSVPTVAGLSVDGERARRRWSGLALGVVVAGAAFTALRLQRDGHTTGDDFALYLNQARALFEGNVAEVTTTNRFLWRNSVAVTPPIYPWGFPLLLSPFVRLWGVSAYDRLKMIEVLAFAAWLVLFHGIVRRRAGRVVALALTAVFATAPVYLMHTDQLLTEFPHMMATAAVIWWLDRVLTRGRLTAATTRELVVLGLLMVAAYNVRRESIVLVAVVAAAQLVELLGQRRRESTRWRDVAWRTVGLPHATFVAGAVLFQLIIPSTLVPDNGNSFGNIWARLFSLDAKTKDLPYQLTLQLGLGSHPALGAILLGLAGAGAVVACRRRPRLNVPLAALTAGTMLLVGTHFRMVSRYYFQVTPFLAYFVTMLLVVTAEAVLGGRRLRPARRRVLLTALVAPALWLVVLHVWALPARVDAADAFNASGQVQSGGLTARTEPAFDAILKYTRQDDVVVYYRVRSMTLYTDRRGVQTTLIDKAARLGDYFMQNLRSNYSQPVATEGELSARGWVVVWEDANWRLWRIVRDLP